MIEAHENGLHYQPGNCHFSINKGFSRHNAGVEYALFAIWEDARENIDGIRQYLKTNFETVLETRFSPHD